MNVKTRVKAWLVKYLGTDFWLTKSLRKDFLFTASLAGLFVIFKSPIESFLTSVLVEPILSKVKSHWSIDVVATCLIIYLLVTWLRGFNKIIPSVRMTFSLCLFTTIYIFYRASGETWSFTESNFWPTIAYADILVSITLGQLILLKNRRIKPRKENDELAFIHDQPLGSEGEDILGFEPYAKRIAEKITAKGFDESFAIGINGKWGSGKTSFLDLVERNLDKDSTILLKFTPWNSQSPKSIISDFFETVISEVAKFHSPLAKLLIEYSKKLVEVNPNKFTTALNTLLNSSQKNQALANIHKSINTELQRTGKLLVVFIDDIDRLDKEEIVEVIRLIRNTANFQNTYFLAAYDRDYVINALSQLNSHNHHEFLEKIFQLEINLPMFSKVTLQSHFHDQTIIRIPRQYQDQFNQSTLGRRGYDKKFYLDRWLNSMRDVTRFSNSLILNLEGLWGQVYLYDFIRIELLRFKFPSVYELLKNNRNTYLELPEKGVRSESTFVLKTFERNLRSDKFHDTIFGDYIKRNAKSLSLSNESLAPILELLQDLFPERSFMIRDEEHLSIRQASKIDSYFYYRLPPGRLSQVEFIQARRGGKEILKKSITKWVAQGLQLEVIRKFNQISKYQNREDFENIIEGIFHLANQKAEGGIRPFSLEGFVGYTNSDLISKLSDHEFKLSKKFYEENPERPKDFIRNILSNAEHPYVVEAEFLYDVRADMNMDSFPLPKEELEKVSGEYLSKYCQESKKLDHYLWHLFNCCGTKEWVPKGGGSYSRRDGPYLEKSIAILKDFVLEKDMDGFLLSQIRSDMRNEKVFAMSDFASTLFGDWESFEKVLSTLNESDHEYLEEFKEFYSVFKTAGGNQHVSFTFKKIPVAKNSLND